jgi:Cd(II)/Pb(II)-responsive transcriptional regulator
VRQPIGRLARRFGVSVATIRYYERTGLLPQPTRTAANYRQYSERHVEQLAFVLNCRSLDMSHEEIRQLLSIRTTPARGCDDVNALIDAHIGQVARKVADLQQMLADLRALRQSCGAARTVQDCEILTTLKRSKRSARAAQD